MVCVLHNKTNVRKYIIRRTKFYVNTLREKSVCIQFVERGDNMAFKNRLRDARVRANMTQVELAKAVGMTARTIQNYELGSQKPRGCETVAKLAEALGVALEDLMGPADIYVLQANEKGGTKVAKEIDDLVSEVTGMFTGGKLSKDALDGAMKALNEAYWIAKEKNKKYTPKQYHKSKDD